MIRQLLHGIYSTLNVIPFQKMSHNLKGISINIQTIFMLEFIYTVKAIKEEDRISAVIYVWGACIYEIVMDVHTSENIQSS